MRETLGMLFNIIRPFTVLRWSVYFFAAVVLWLIFDYPLLQEYFQARQRRDQYRELVSQEEKRKESLRQEHEALKQGGFPAEKAIRERQKMIKPGEGVYFIETPTATPRP